MESIPSPPWRRVSYVDGVTGANVFVMTLDGARKLAAAMMGMEQPEDRTPRSCRARALGRLGGHEPDDGLRGDGGLLGAGHRGRDPGPRPRCSPTRPRRSTPIRRPRTPCGRRSRCAASRALVQLVPNAFVVRMTRALDELVPRCPAPSRPPRPRLRRRAALPPVPARPRLRVSPCASGRSWARRRCHPRRWSDCPRRGGGTQPIGRRAD